MANDTLKVDGLKHLERKLRRLDDALAGRALEGATRDGAKVFRDDMRRRAPRSDRGSGSRGHGHAADYIDVESRQASRNEASFNIGPPRWGWYLVFAEFGARPHTITPDAASVLRMPGNIFAQSVDHPGLTSRPWMRPAFDTRKGDAVRTVRSSLAARIRQAAR